jgi:hypothetical protein
VLTNVTVTPDILDQTGAFLIVFVDTELLPDVEEASGIYIEAKPNKTLTMALEDPDTLILSEKIAEIVEQVCPGLVLDPVLIEKFEGKLKKDGAELDIKFDSSFEYFDPAAGKVKKGSFKFDTKADSIL